MHTHPFSSNSHTHDTVLCCVFRYMQTNGYKPAPLDLNHVKLTPNQNTLVERLADNDHNVWARDRVHQGWTYSIVQVPHTHTHSYMHTHTRTQTNKQVTERACK